MQVPEDILTDIGTTEAESNFTPEVSPAILAKDHDVTTDEYPKKKKKKKKKILHGFYVETMAELTRKYLSGMVIFNRFPQKSLRKQYRTSSSKSSAHEFDTIWTVIQNSMGMTKTLCQRYMVIIFDEQLYSKA